MIALIVFLVVLFALDTVCMLYFVTRWTLPKKTKTRLTELENKHTYNQYCIKQWERQWDKLCEETGETVKPPLYRTQETRAI